MPDLVNAQTGVLEFVPDEQADAAIQGGSHQLARGSKYVVVGEDGKSWKMDKPEDVYKALNEGYRLESDIERQGRVAEQEYGGALGTTAAATTGLARGATFGLSDLFYKAGGFASPETLRNLREVNEGASMGGEIAGAALPLLLSGGAGLAASTGKGLLSTIGKQAAVGAAEGAAVGAGQQISESALGDTELTAENLLMGAGMGALVGAGSAAALGLAGAGLSAAKRAAEKPLERLAKSDLGEMIRTKLDDIAREGRFKATFGVNKKAYKMIDDKGIEDKVDDVLKDLVKAGDNLESISAKATAKLEQAREKTGGILNQLDNNAARKGVNLEEVAQQIEAKVIKKLDPSTQKGAISAIRGHIQSLTEDYADRMLSPGEISFSDASSIRRAAQKNGNFDASVAGPVREAWREVSSIWNEIIDKKAAPLLKESGLDEAAYRTARHEQGVLEEIVKHSENRVQGNRAVRFVSPSDYGMGAVGTIGSLVAGSGSLTAMATGAATSMANKAFRSYAPAVVADLADRTAKLTILNRKAVQAATNASSAIKGFLASAADAVAGGVAATKAASPATAASILGSVAFLPEAQSRLARNTDQERKSAKQTEADLFKKRSAEISQLANNPQLLMEHVGNVTANLQKTAPGTAVHLAAKINKAVEFLASKLPKDSQAPNPLVKREWTPAASEIAKFARYLRAVEQPMTVLEDLKERRLSAEGVEVLQNVYPKLYQNLVNEVVSQLSEKPQSFTYQDKVQLSLFINQPLDPSLTPEAIAASQQRWVSQPQQPGKGGGGTRVSGISKLTTDDAAKTRSQRLAEGL